MNVAGVVLRHPVFLEKSFYCSVRIYNITNGIHALPGVDLSDLLVHGAGVDSRPITRIFRRQGFFIQILLRVFH